MPTSQCKLRLCPAVGPFLGSRTVEHEPVVVAAVFLTHFATILEVCSCLDPRVDTWTVFVARNRKLLTLPHMKSRCSGGVLGFELQGALRTLDPQWMQ